MSACALGLWFGIQLSVLSFYPLIFCSRAIWHSPHRGRQAMTTQSSHTEPWGKKHRWNKLLRIIIISCKNEGLFGVRGTLTWMWYLLRMLVLRAIMAPGRKGTQQLSPLSWATLQPRIHGMNVAQRPGGERHSVTLEFISQCWLNSACVRQVPYRFHSRRSSRTHLNSNLIIRRTPCTVCPEAASLSH